VRGTLPRFRYDQLMGFGWKFLMPLAIANILATSLWLALPRHQPKPRLLSLSLFTMPPGLHEEGEGYGLLQSAFGCFDLGLKS
jgi:hypothetical protein